MSPLLLLPFGVFAICCVLQFWFLHKVRVALINRHPDTFLELEKSAFFPMQGLWKFTRGDRYKQLKDATLDRHVRNLKRLMIVAYASWLTYAVALFTVPMNVPKLPITIANGAYQNDCCGTLVLQDGRMSAMNQSVSYVIERDKGGPYVLPSVYVGGSAKGLVIERSKASLKLHLDDAENPTAIELMNAVDGTVFSFRRVNGS
jgi:hypothetical protein